MFVVVEENVVGWRRDGGCEVERLSVGVEYDDDDIDHKIGYDKVARNSEMCP